MRFLFTLALAMAAAAPAATWRVPPAGSARIAEEQGASKVTTSDAGEWTLDSEREYAARAAETFQVSVRIRVDLHTRALPELACFDAAGRPIAGPNTLASGPSTTTTDWQSYQRIFVTLPGTARVRARIRATGKGTFSVADLLFAPRAIDSYQTGALISQVHPRNRRGLVLESNLGIVNPEMVSPEDRDGDGKWALILVDLDELSRLEKKGVDWRTKFEYKPNEIYWSDGAVLKSDSTREDRAPDARRALHFRMRVHPGRYGAILNDPGRAVAVSKDGKTWRRYEGGGEAELGSVDAGGGWIELWVDSCYRDKVSVGPAYFDYVRLYPADDSEAAEKLFAAARQTIKPPERGSVEERRVTVTTAAKVASARWPLRCGLPVPRGELAVAGRVMVRNAAGVEVPSQRRAMALWPDGSVKWLYLDFAGGTAEKFTVVYGNQVNPAPVREGVKLARSADGIEVDTGAIRFRVPAARFGMVENVRLPSGRVLQSGAVEAEIVEAGGKTWRAADLPVAKIEIEQAGPQHAVVVVQAGKPGEGFLHRARIHAYAASRLVEIDYFVANADNRPRVMARSIVLRAPSPLNGAGEQVQAGEKPPFAPGWASLPLAGGGMLFAGVADFREQYPKSLRWNRSGIEIGLWAREGGDYEWIQGVGKTHYVALLYSEGPAEGGALVAQGPVLAAAAPEWYAASGAFGPIATARESVLPGVEKTLAAHMKESVVGRVGLGFENYGDHSSGGYVAGTYLWDNNEYDLPAACFVHFARTGDREALRLGLASALHYLEVDTIHFSSRKKDWVGAAHTHSHGDVGHHTADAPNMHHAGYVQGLLLYSFLTGDPAGVAGARGIADWVLRNISPEATVGMMERALGHPLTTLTDVYEATWDERYLRGAARLVDWAIKWEHPVRSGFLAPITEQPAYYSGSTFCGGLITAALLKFNGWARVPEIDAMLERVARWLLTDMWRPPGGIFSKGGSPRRDARPEHVASHLRLLRAVYERTEDPLFLAAPREMLVAGFGGGKDNIHTRSTGLVYNYMPWFLPLVRPAPDERLRVTAPKQPLVLARDGRGQVCFALRNEGSEAIENLRVSFQPRLDFVVTRAAVVAPSLAPGATAEACYEVRAPAAINLTSLYNRVAYGQWSAAFRRGGAPALAHAYASFELR